MRVAHNEETRIRQKPRVLLVEPEPAQAKQAVTALSSSGYDCQACADADSAIALVRDPGADALVIDLAPSINPADLLRRVRLEAPQTAVILLVANPTVPAAVAAMRQGAFAYLTKPINPDELTEVTARALELAALRRENRVLHEQLEVASMAAAFIAESPSSRSLAEIIRRAAPATSPVLVEGESGTGKELVARMLHHWSVRAGGPFVKLNFKSLSGAGLGFGIEETAWRIRTGADAMIAEYAERAMGGTLFLNEIAEAPPEFQSALLRLAGDGEASRRYAPGTRPPGMRLVVSSNRPLAREVAAGRFRPDLYFALNVIPIQVPPLRERREDILPLARHFLARHAAESGRAMTLAADAEKALLSYSWPGNVRELENVIERAVVMSPGERIPAESLILPRESRAGAPHASGMHAPAEAPEPSAAQAPQSAQTAAQAQSASAEEAAEVSAANGSQQASAEAVAFTEGTLQDTLDRAAAIRIKKAIEAALGNRNAAAAALGIDRTTLYRLIRRLGL